MQLDATQTEAVKLATDTKAKLVGVTGKAGTGKTTIIKMAHDQLVQQGRIVAIAAPTGRAAKRIQEATGISAFTIHRLLEFPMPGEIDPETGKVLSASLPQRHSKRPLEADCIFIDEAAMINWQLHRYLMHAVPRGGIVRYFGDRNQLPPISEYGSPIEKDWPSPFIKVISKFPSITLETIHRQGEGSGIVAAGDRILAGRIPARNDEVKLEVVIKVIDAFRQAFKDNLDKYKTFEWQAITPARKGKMGSNGLNLIAQKLVYAASEPFVELPRHTWDEADTLRVHVGEKVIWVQNDYNLKIFNGEVGIITDIASDGSLMIQFDDRELHIPTWINAKDPKTGRFFGYDPRVSVDLAYVLTTHKAQGSEFDRVMYVMTKSKAYNLNRNNFYTGVTRARSGIHIITDSGGLNMAVQKKGL